MPDGDAPSDDDASIETLLRRRADDIIFLARPMMMLRATLTISSRRDSSRPSISMQMLAAPRATALGMRTQAMLARQ